MQEYTSSGGIKAGTGITETTYDFKDGGQGWGSHSGHYETAYKWDSHYIRKGQVSAVDGAGVVVTYFNS